MGLGPHVLLLLLLLTCPAAAAGLPCCLLLCALPLLGLAVQCNAVHAGMGWLRACRQPSMPLPPARSYQPHGVKMLYDGVPVDLTPEQEEVATMFAVMKETGGCCCCCAGWVRVKRRCRCWG